MEVGTCRFYKYRTILPMGITLPVYTLNILLIGSFPTAPCTFAKPSWRLSVLVDGKVLHIDTLPLTLSILEIESEVRLVLPAFRCARIVRVVTFVAEHNAQARQNRA